MREMNFYRRWKLIALLLDFTKPKSVFHPPSNTKSALPPTLTSNSHIIEKRNVSDLWQASSCLVRPRSMAAPRVCWRRVRRLPLDHVGFLQRPSANTGAAPPLAANAACRRTGAAVARQLLHRNVSDRQSWVSSHRICIWCSADVVIEGLESAFEPYLEARLETGAERRCFSAVGRREEGQWRWRQTPPPPPLLLHTGAVSADRLWGSSILIAVRDRTFIAEHDLIAQTSIELEEVRHIWHQLCHSPMLMIIKSRKFITGYCHQYYDWTIWFEHGDNTSTWMIMKSGFRKY